MDARKAWTALLHKVSWPVGGAPETKKAHKYHAEATFVDGHYFPSKREANRYGELKLLQAAGAITDLELQKSFALHVGTTVIGTYRADFTYYEAARLIIEDAKGVRTPLYRWKKKHFDVEYAEHGFAIREV